MRGDTLVHAIAHACELPPAPNTRLFTSTLSRFVERPRLSDLFLQHLTRRCSRSGEVAVWWEILRLARQCDFRLTRTNVALHLNPLSTSFAFSFTDIIEILALAHVHSSTHVTYWTWLKMVFRSTTCSIHGSSNYFITWPSIIDNVYRTTVPRHEFPHRAGIVPEWVIPHHPEGIHDGERWFDIHCR